MQGTLKYIRCLLLVILVIIFTQGIIYILHINHVDFTEAIILNSPNPAADIEPDIINNRSLPELLPILTAIDETNFKASAFIDVPFISQWPELPTGCEITAAAMLLNHYGVNADKCILSWNYLPTTDAAFYSDDDGNFYGPDPYKYFIGDPESFYGYGCFATVICNMLNIYLTDNNSNCFACDITGCDFNYLIKCLNEQIPVIIWSNGCQMPLFDDSAWYTPDGNLITWFGNEHCMLLVGYDQNGLWFNDPLMEDESYGVVQYDYSSFQYYWEMLGKQAVIITK